MLNKIDFNKVLEDVLVKSMTNKNNKELYIEVITLDTIAKLIDNDSEKASVVWNALHRAETWFYEMQAEQEYKQELEKELFEQTTLFKGCPECGYEFANGYKHCPNCGLKINNN